MSKTHYTVNVSMKVPGKLNDVSEYIEFFKELGGAEYLEKTEIQRTVGSREDRTYSPSGITTEQTEVMTHGRTVHFKFKVPFTLDTESVFRGYHVTPINAVAKYFDEFIQYVKKPRPAGAWSSSYNKPQELETAEPVVDAAIIKNTFYKLEGDDWGVKQRWGKDKPLLEPNIVIN